MARARDLQRIGAPRGRSIFLCAVDPDPPRSTNGQKSITGLAGHAEEKTRAGPENYTLFVVRSPGGRGGEVLCVDLSELKDCQNDPLRKERSGACSSTDDRR